MTGLLKLFLLSFDGRTMSLKSKYVQVGVGAEMITVLLLVIIIFVLLALLLFSGGGVFRVRRLSAEADDMREELKRLQAANEAIRGSLDTHRDNRARTLADVIELTRDLETLRSAVAGSSVCQKSIVEKYGVQPSPELVTRILAARLNVDAMTKRKIAHELLVGEVGRTFLRAMRAGRTIGQASADAGVPVVVGKGQVKRLQVFGYLDERLELTELGREALA